MNLEDESAALEPRSASSTEAAPERKILELPEAGSEEAKPAALEGIEVPESDKVAKQQPSPCKSL